MFAKIPDAILCVALFIFLCFWPSAGWSEENYDLFGGWMPVTDEAEIYFRVKEIDGVWWFINPAGNGFISKGVNHVSLAGFYAPSLGYSPYQRHVANAYASQKAWAQSACARLKQWGFNTLGAQSSSLIAQMNVPHTELLHIGQAVGANRRLGIFPDVFSDAFSRHARRIARTAGRKNKENVFFLGYFTDAELFWGQDHRRGNTLLEDYLRLDRESQGFKRAVQFLRETYPSIHALNMAWGIGSESFSALALPEAFKANETFLREADEFLGIVADEYFRVCHHFIREYDPNHLILGCRFDENAPIPVLKAASRYVDVISLNTYLFPPSIELLRAIHELTGKPILISEFSLKAGDAGLPNSKGKGKVYRSQQDRANGYAIFVRQIMEQPFVVGYHWYCYMDQPEKGDYYGEDNNYGLVSNQDEPWLVLTEAASEINRQVEAIHRGSPPPR
jgi:hypothetical protein